MEEVMGMRVMEKRERANFPMGMIFARIYPN
jgi:hypothetical protein